MCTCFLLLNIQLYIYHLIARPNGTKIARKRLLTLLLNPRKQKQKMHRLQRKNFSPQPLITAALAALSCPSTLSVPALPKQQNASLHCLGGKSSQ